MSTNFEGKDKAQYNSSKISARSPRLFNRLMRSVSTTRTVELRWYYILSFVDSSNKAFFEEHPFGSVLFIAEQMYIVPNRNSATVHAVLRLWKASLNPLSNLLSTWVLLHHITQRIARRQLEEELEAYFQQRNNRKKEKQVLRGQSNGRQVPRVNRSVIISCVGFPVLCAQRRGGFSYQLNRSNVTISRPKYRLLFICSQTFLLHIPKQESASWWSKGSMPSSKICTLQKTVSENGYDSILHYSSK